MKKIKPFTYFLCALTVLFALFAPPLIKSGLTRDIYQIREQQEKEAFRGILTLWHVSGWQPGEGSATTFLKKAAQSYERSHAYCFIEIIALTPEKARARLLAGEKPDMISFPTGFLGTPEGLAPIKKQPLHNPSLASSGDYFTQTFAMPYMAGAYFLAVNEELLYEQSLDAQAVAALERKELLETAARLSEARQAGKKKVQNFGLAAEKQPGCSPLAALAFFRTLPPKAETPGEIEPLETESAPSAAPPPLKAASENGVALFTERKAALLLGSQSALTALKNSAKSPPAYAAWPFSTFSDMAQYMAMFKTGDAKRQTACEEFIYSLLEPKTQQRLEALKALPVVPLEGLFAEEPLYQEAYGQLLQNGVFPETFGYGALWEKLSIDAAAFCGGDAEALNRMSRLIQYGLY